MSISNVKKLYLYRVFGSLSFTHPIYVLYLLQKGLNMTEVMLLQAVFTAVMLIFSIPAGVFADRIGRKPIMVISTFLYALANVGYYLSNTFLEFFITEIIIAIGVAMWESTWYAFLYDSLKEKKKEKYYKKAYGNLIAISGVSTAVASIFGVTLAEKFGYAILFLITAISIGFGFIIQLFLREPQIKAKETDKWKHIIASFKSINGNKNVKTLMVYSSLLGAIFFCAFFLYQPYFVSIGVPLIAIGGVYALMQLTFAFGGKSAHWLENRLGYKRSLVVASALPAIIFLIMGSTSLVWLSFLPMLIYFIDAFKSIVISDYVNKQIRSRERATITAMGFCMFNIFSSIINPIVGRITDMFGINIALLTLSLGLVIILLGIIRTLKD